MRKITREAGDAFFSKVYYPFKRDNTKVESVGYIRILSLHGHDIAHRDEKTGVISISLAGWNTNTTRERLNGLYIGRVTKKNGKSFLNGEEWDGNWKTI